MALARLGADLAAELARGDPRCGSRRRRSRSPAAPRGSPPPGCAPASRSRSRPATRRPRARGAWPPRRSPRRSAAGRACPPRSRRRSSSSRSRTGARRSARPRGRPRTSSARPGRARGRRPTSRRGTPPPSESAAAARSRSRRPRAAGSRPRPPPPRRPGSAAPRPPPRSGRAARSLRLLLRDEADRAAGLEHRPAHLLERVDLVQARLLLELLARQALAVHVARRARVRPRSARSARPSSNGPDPLEAEVDVRDRDLHQRDRPGREHAAP